MNRKTHDEAMHMIYNADGVAHLSYEEVVAVYIRARGILRDEFDGTPGKPLGAPIPEDWDPPQPL